MRKKKISIIGMASCYGAQDMRCAAAPQILKKLNLDGFLNQAPYQADWLKTIYPDHIPNHDNDKTNIITEICKQLARQAYRVVYEKNKLVVIGGDHSCAIGTWSGVFRAIKDQGDLGLIWIDAHMDSHTPATSPSNAIHGMPLAVLLGYGDSALTNIADSSAKLKPENVCLIGIRSYEPGEAELLSQLGVKIFYMEDVKRLGLQQVLTEAQSHVSKNTAAYGISLDLDAIDPSDAPGVGSPEVNGISGQELIESLNSLSFDEKFTGMEIAELNSEQDNDDKTAMLAIRILQAIFK